MADKKPEPKIGDRYYYSNDDSRIATVKEIKGRMIMVELDNEDKTVTHVNADSLKRKVGAK